MASLRWRQQFTRTYRERDVPQLGIHVGADSLRRFWTMIAHYHGQTWNGAELARAFGVTDKTVRHYLDVLESELGGRGFDGHFLMMRSGGGAMTVGAAKERPINLVLSGPAGGVVGAAAFAELVDAPNLITLDMGGTSLDAAIIIGGQPSVTTAASFQGLPVSLPLLVQSFE